MTMTVYEVALRAGYRLIADTTTKIDPTSQRPQRIEVVMFKVLCPEGTAIGVDAVTAQVLLAMRELVPEDNILGAVEPKRSA